MESRNIIIVLLVIIAIILAAILGVMFLPSMEAKKDCKLSIEADSTLYEGDNITVKLTAMDGSAIANQKVNITLSGEDGTGDSYSLFTDSNGEIEIILDEMVGKYVVNCTYGGNGDFEANSTSKNIEIIEVAAESEPQQSTQESSSSSDDIYYDEELNVYYDSNGVVVDPDGEHPMEVGRQYSELAERREKWERGELVM